MTYNQRLKQREANRRYIEKHPDRAREYSHKYMRANREMLREKAYKWYIENKDRADNNSREYRKNNLEKHRQQVRYWREKNLEKAHEAEHRWRYNNPDRVRIKAQNRQRATSGKISKNIIKILWDKQDGYCAYNLLCHADLYIEGYHLDHTMQLALGGKHEDSNLQLTCPSCNMRKGSLHPDEFLRRL